MSPSRALCPLLAVLGGLLAGCAGTGSVAVSTPLCRHGNEAAEKAIGYCRTVRVGDVLYVSGVTAPGPMDQAVPRVYAALQSILQANGLTFANVAKENVYATDLDQFIQASEARKPYYGATLPAATWVQVQRLFRPNFVLEVELIAHYPR